MMLNFFLFFFLLSSISIQSTCCIGTHQDIIDTSSDGDDGDDNDDKDSHRNKRKISISTSTSSFTSEDSNNNNNQIKRTLSSYDDEYNNKYNNNNDWKKMKQWKFNHDLKADADIQIWKLHKNKKSELENDTTDNTDNRDRDNRNQDTFITLVRRNSAHDSTVKEEIISLRDGMKPIKLFTSDIRIILDGIELQDNNNNINNNNNIISLQQLQIYEKKHHDWNILLYPNQQKEGEIKRIFSIIYGETFVDMIRLDDDDDDDDDTYNTSFQNRHSNDVIPEDHDLSTTTSTSSSFTSFGVILPDMIDTDRLNKKFRYDHQKINNKEKQQQHQFRKNRKLRALSSSPQQQQLEQLEQDECLEYTPIIFVIAFDSTYCDQIGGTHTKALEDITEIMAQVQQMYKQPGICIDLKITHIEGFCDSDEDPYKDILASGYSGCGSEDGALQGLKSLWNNADDEESESTIQRNFVYLFTGTPFECNNNNINDDEENYDNVNCIIGCSYWNVLCRPYFGYSLSYTTFSTNQNLRAVSIAHEIGHNHGALHYFSSSSSSSSLFSMLLAITTNIIKKEIIDENKQEKKEKDPITHAMTLQNYNNNYNKNTPECENQYYIMNESVNDGERGFSEQSVSTIKANVDAYLSGTCDTSF